MVHTLAEASENVKRRVVIAGEMLELGLHEREMHREAGREIARLGIDVLWGVRGLAAEMVSAAGGHGIQTTRFFESSDLAATAALDLASEGDLILIKGSRSVETDKIVLALKERFPLAGQ
jgi:UDP-N-acetylmuramoyl-tripeptide--D-alanyl-D-alanine ligase